MLYSCMCAICTSYVCRSQKKGWDPLEPELRMLVNTQMYARMYALRIALNALNHGALSPALSRSVTYPPFLQALCAPLWVSHWILITAHSDLHLPSFCFFPFPFASLLNPAFPCFNMKLRPHACSSPGSRP